MYVIKDKQVIILFGLYNKFTGMKTTFYYYFMSLYSGRLEIIMKRILSICLIFSMILTMNRVAYASNSKVLEKTIKIDGITITEQDFKDTFSGKPISRKDISSVKSISSAKIALSDIALDDNNVSFVANLNVGNQKVTLQVNGNLYASYKTQNGINSAIIDTTPSTISGYQFLLIELFNDSSDDNLLLTSRNDKKNISNKPHMKLYMKDGEGKLYLFESEIPAVFANLEAINYPIADKDKDALWSKDLVKHEMTELPTDTDMLLKMGLLKNTTKALNSWTLWNNPTTYYYAFYLGSDFVQCYSLPYVEYRHTNVSSGDSTWAASFKVAEHTTIGGITYYGNNVFEYRNLKIAFACGDKSTFIRTYQAGRVYDNSGLVIKDVGKSIAVSLLNKAVTSLPYGSTFQSVLGYINTMSSASGNVTLGSTGVTLSNRKTTAVGEKLTKYSVSKCTNYNGSTNNGHYFTYQAVLQYEATPGNTSTVGALLVSFDRFSNSDSTTISISKSFQLNYTAQQ